MIVTIHQPDFIPWLGFFDRWAKSDLYIILDDVQFLRRGWHHRDRIKTKNGLAWLTVPVKTKGKYQEQIKNIEIDNSNNWKRKHLETIRIAYAQSPLFSDIFCLLEKVYAKEKRFLVDLNMELLDLMAGQFEIKAPRRFSSDLDVEGSSTQKLVNLVEKAGGDIYLSGQGARDYIDESLFKEKGIEVMWQEFESPTYPQPHGEFVPGLSAIDYIFNCRDERKNVFGTDFVRKASKS